MRTKAVHRLFPRGAVLVGMSALCLGLAPDQAQARGYW